MMVVIRTCFMLASVKNFDEHPYNLAPSLNEVSLFHQSKPLSNSRVVSKSVYFSDNYSQYLCFSVFCSTNKLVLERNKHLWSEEQQKTHDLIKSLHDSGMGYRKISYHLNELGIKTPKGNLWGGNNVHSVLKRNRERLRRLEI